MFGKTSALRESLAVSPAVSWGSKIKAPALCFGSVSGCLGGGSGRLLLLLLLLLAVSEKKGALA